MKLPLVSRVKWLQAEARATSLADRLRVLEARLADAEAQSAASAAEARESLRLVADWLAQQQFGIKIFGSTGPALPDQAPNAEILDQFNNAHKRKRPRDIVREAEQEFARQYEKLAANAG